MIVTEGLYSTIPLYSLLQKSSEEQTFIRKERSVHSLRIMDKLSSVHEELRTSSVTGHAKCVESIANMRHSRNMQKMKWVGSAVSTVEVERSLKGYRRLFRIDPNIEYSQRTSRRETIKWHRWEGEWIS